MMRIILNYIIFHEGGATFNIDIINKYQHIRGLDIDFTFDTYSDDIEKFENMYNLLMMGVIDRELTIKFISSEIRETVNGMLSNFIKKYKVLKDNTIFLVLGS